MTQSKDNQEWEKEFEKRFSDFPTSATWFVPVREFIRESKSKDKERLLEDVLKKINWGCKLERKDGEVCGLCFYDEYANSIQNQLIQLKG